MEHSKHKHALVCREESDMVDIGCYEGDGLGMIILVR
jgi:hypothetical protein